MDLGVLAIVRWRCPRVTAFTTMYGRDDRYDDDLRSYESTKKTCCRGMLGHFSGSPYAPNVPILPWALPYSNPALGTATPLFSNPVAAPLIL
jgi:hypothetical protein